MPSGGAYTPCPAADYTLTGYAAQHRARDRRGQWRARLGAPPGGCESLAAGPSADDQAAPKGVADGQTQSGAGR